LYHSPKDPIRFNPYLLKFKGKNKTTLSENEKSKRIWIENPMNNIKKILDIFFFEKEYDIKKSMKNAIGKMIE
jgi:hypothetical protein